MRYQQSLSRLLTLTIVPLVLNAGPLLAQCTGSEVSFNDFVNEFMKVTLEELAAQQSLDTPLEAAPSEQIAAPADSSGSTSLVNGAAFPSLLGVAMETGLVSEEDGVMTVDLNLFAFKAALSPQVIYQQSLYDDFNGLRRFGGSVSFGGKGESFDRDGDGQADPALKAEELGDILNWELRWRFSGSRDRRDEENYKEFFAATRKAFDRSSVAYNAFVSRHTDEVVQTLASASQNGCLDRAKMEQWVQDPTIRLELLGVLEANQALNADVKKAAEKVDRRTVWSLFAGGISRRDEFGQDSVKAGLRGVWGGDENGLTFNLEGAQTDGPNGADDPLRAKAALEGAVLVFKGLALTQEAAKNGVRLSLSGSYEKFWDVPGANHDTNAKLNAKLELPLTASVKIPISVTWANHKDLIEGEEEISGHIGFTLDLSALRNAIQP